MKKHFLKMASVITLLFLATGCTLWEEWMGDDQPKQPHSNLKTDAAIKKDNPNNMTVVDDKKIPEVLSKAAATKQKTANASYQIQGIQKLTNEEGPINDNKISLKGNEETKTKTLHLTGKINNSKNYEVWQSQDMIYEKMTSEWLARKTSEAKRSPFDTLVILNKAQSSLEELGHTTGVTLKEENGNYILSASKNYLNHSPAIQKEMTQYIHEGVQTALNESDSKLKLEDVNIKKFHFVYEINGSDYQYFKVKMSLSYDYTLNGKKFGVEEEIEKLNTGTFKGTLQIPSEITEENKNSNESSNVIRT